jgi:site-specific recombinase XerD
MKHPWSLRKKDQAPRGVRQLGGGIWGIRYACALKHLHKERVGRVKRDAITTYNARRARALSEPGWCPALERRQERERATSEAARRMAFRQYAEQFRDWREVNQPRSRKNDAGRFPALIDHFGDHAVDAIKPLDIERFRDGLLARGLARSTTNRWRALLSALFKRAVRDGHVTANPVRAVPAFQENNARIAYLTTEDETVIREALPASYRPHFDVSINTGLRWSEQMNLRWRDVDVLTGIITIPLSKHGEARRVPMNSTVRAVLLDLGTRRQDPTAADELVFSPRPKQADSFFPKAVERARKALEDDSRLRGYVWHSNRHTFASRLVMAGVDLMTVKELGGWKTLVMVQRYAHLAPGHLQAAVERLVSPSPGVEVSRKYPEDRASVAPKQAQAVRNSH